VNPSDCVILLDDQQFEIGDTARLFHSIVFGRDGRMHLLCRHEKIRGARESVDPTLFQSKTEHSVYDLSASLKLQSRRVIDDSGEECRTWQQPDGTPYALFMHTNTGLMQGYDFRIANLNTGDIQTINFPGGMNFPKGKNWMPFALNEREIGFVHGNNPLRILACDPATGATREVYADAGSVTTIQAMHDNFNIFRGGTNLIPNGAGWEGYGHTTSEPYIHLPYKFHLIKKADGGFDFTMKFDLDLSPLQEAGFSILDPTAYFDDPDGNRWLALCCSERTWFWGQRILSLLWPIEIKNPDGAFIRAMQSFMCQKADFAQAISLYPRQRTMGPTTFVSGAGGIILGKRSLFHANPKTMHAQEYHCDFYYAGYAAPEHELAELGFYLCKDGKPTQMHMQIPLQGTGDAIQRVEFDLPPLPPNIELMITCQYHWTAPIEFFHLQLREQRTDWPRPTLYGAVG
jgi:hypothetical protein